MSDGLLKAFKEKLFKLNFPLKYFKSPDILAIKSILPINCCSSCMTFILVLLSQMRSCKDIEGLFS